MNKDQKDSLDSLNTKKGYLRDRVRQVANGESPGAYVFGRPGTAKTYTIVKTLEAIDAPYVHKSAHLTPIGLFNLLMDNHNRIVVLDDVSALFNQPIALQILLAATGWTPSGQRIVSHTTAAGDTKFVFSGGIVAISNLGLDGHKSEVLAALKDRIFSIQYEPTDEEICAEIFNLAETPSVGKGLTQKEKKEVAHFLIEECLKREIRPSIRLFIDKALPDYRSWKSVDVESHWQDLIVSNLEQMTVEITKPVNDLTFKEEQARFRKIAGEVYEGIDSAQRLKVFKERTGLGKNRYYAYLKEWQKSQAS